MLIIHAVKKLLNTSHIEAGLYITTPSEGQLLHSWYATLLSSGFAGKLFTLYVHEPSMLTVVCPGKTVASTWPTFTTRLDALLHRYHFTPGFIAAEMAEANGYVVGKTNSRSMLGHINQFILQLEYDCRRFDRYEDIDLELLEDRIMDYWYGIAQRDYTTPKKYWLQAGKIIAPGD